MQSAFDYIVVGAGSAGCVLAERLSASGKHSVLVIEAGAKERNPLYRLPMLAGRMYRFKINNWYYQSKPQASMNGREIFLPRGKMVGGSFIFNGMQYVRGHSSIYDSWAQMGNRGWSYADVLPFFKKSEQYYAGANEFHGEDGALPVTKAPESNPLSLAFLEACAQAGHPLNDDFNGASQDGFGLFDFNIKNGRRVNTAHSFLYPALRRSNVSLIAGAQVNRVLVSDGRATGVEIKRNGRNETIGARAEVILCAGAFNSPKILMLSGLGDADQLKSVGITPIAQLPGVGKNLQDHINVGVGHQAKEAVSVVGSLRLDRLVWEMGRAVVTRKGPVARSVLEAGGFFRSRPGLSAPDCQVVFTPIFGPAARIWAPWNQTLADHSFGAVIWPIYPDSRGEVRLSSSNPASAPIIDPNFLTAQSDLETTYRGLEELRRIFSQKALTRYRGDEIAPGAETTSKEALIAYARQVGGSGHHAIGTAKMGSDAMAVVDDRLRVRGITNLRVADASIMPTMASGNTNAPVIMIAEKAADFIMHQ